MPKPLPQVITKETVKTDVKYKTKIVTLPNGTKTETIEVDSKTVTNSSSAPTKAQYSLALSGLKSVEYVSPSARLGDLPLWVGVDIKLKDLKDSKLQLRMEF